MNGKCQKCGWKNAPKEGIRWCDGRSYRCQAELGLDSDINGHDHLHYTCTRCGFSAYLPSLDAKGNDDEMLRVRRPVSPGKRPRVGP